MLKIIADFEIRNLDVAIQSGCMEYSEVDKKIIRELSLNARSTTTHLAEVTGYSRTTVAREIERLVKELDIKFTLEIDNGMMGLEANHFLAVKFDKKPNEAALAKLLKDNMHVQDAYLCEGDFDLLVYAVADRPVDYIVLETHIASSLSEYMPIIRPSAFIFAHFGYMTLDSAFIRSIKPKVIKDEKDKKILEELNSNSRIGYRELAKKVGMSEDVLRYRVIKLVKRKIIRRFTIAIQNPEERYSVAYFMNYKFVKNTASVSFAMAREAYMKDDKEKPMINTFQFISPTSGSYRSFGIVASTDMKNAIEKAVARHKRIFNREEVKISHARILKPIKGLLPYRNLDIEKNYQRVAWV